MTPLIRELRVAAAAENDLMRRRLLMRAADRIEQAETPHPQETPHVRHRRPYPTTYDLVPAADASISAPV